MDSTVSDSLVGRLLDGRYRVESRIARGGMATVYTALDTRLDRIVALKVMHPVFADDEEFVARFIREAKSAARLSHPNIVAVFDQGDDAGRLFLAMEYVQGRTLRDLLRERGRLTPSEALALLAPILSALSAAHAAGIIHRDIKPENVLLADDGRVKVADFGLARALAGNHATSSSTLIGTVAYLAPEQVTRGIADARSDVYAAGVLLYEMLTGAQPYEGETAISVAYRHANEDVPPPSLLAPSVPPSVDELVARATARDPEYRPRDAAALLTEVARVRRGLPALESDATNPTVFTPRGNDTLVVDAGEVAGLRAATPPPAATAPAVAAAVADDAGDGRDGEAKSRKRRRRRRRGLIAFFIVVLLALAAAGAGWWEGVGRYTHAPNLKGLTQSAAVTRLKAEHLTLGSVAQQYDPSASGQIIGQTPGPNAKLKRGATVNITTSRGKHMATVPALDANGETLATYTAAAKKLGFTMAPEVDTYNATVPKGDLISVDPTPGNSVIYGSAITPTVSLGPQPIDVPDYTGKAASDAVSALTALGFTVPTPTQDYSDSVPSGTVISQTPNSGTQLPGATITLDVSKGPQLFPVPDVTSTLANPATWKTVADATSILTQAGFKVAVSHQGAFDIVTSQNPKAGTMEPKGFTVTIGTVTISAH